MEIPGGSDELLGLSSTGDQQVSGRLAEVRASNGLKGNRGLFDNLERTLSEIGDLTVQTIQKNYSPGKIRRIINKEPTEQFFSGDFEQYDCFMKQAVLTQSQREAYYYQLLQLRSLDIPIPDDEIIDAAPLQGKTRLRQKMAEIAEQQQQFAAQEAEDRAIQNQLLQSQSEQSIALAQERRARVLADIGLAKERESEAEQNYARALLDNAKTMKEVEDLDRKRLVDVIKLTNELYQTKNAQVEQQMQADIGKMNQLRDNPPT